MMLGYVWIIANSSSSVQEGHTKISTSTAQPVNIPGDYISNAVLICLVKHVMC